MDVFGSNAMAMGGIFGRIDSIYGSIECQKSGTLHLPASACAMLSSVHPIGRAVAFSGRAPIGAAEAL